MKLIHCIFCKDIYSVTYDIKTCSCGRTKALYIDALNIIYGGDSAVCLGIDNNTLDIAEYRQVLDDYAVHIDAYLCALACESTIKIKNLEKMTEKEIFSLYAKTNIIQKKFEKTKKMRAAGLSKMIYSICKRLMRIEISKADSIYLSPQTELWYNDYSFRILNLSKKLAIITGKNTHLDWFDALLAISYRNLTAFIEWEKIDDEIELFDKVSSYLTELDKLENEEEENND